MLSHHSVGGGKFSRSSLRSELTQINSDVALAIALYSASVLDLETVTCFFELQEMRFFPRYMRNPLVERRSRLKRVSGPIRIIEGYERDWGSTAEINAMCYGAFKIA